MKKLWLVVLLVLVAPRLSALSSGDAADRDARAELAEMNVTLREIARLLQDQAALQKSDLLLKRVSLASTELASAQERLKRLDIEVATTKSDQDEFEGMLSRVQAENPTSEESGAARQSRMSGIKSRLASIQERLSGLSRDTISTQNEIETLRREVQDWRAVLDKTLVKP